MRTTAMALILALAACGGGKSSKDDTTPDETGDDTSGDDTGGGGDEQMIPPERMDQITATLDRKRNSSGTRCIERAIDNGELKKNARGTIQLNFVISAAGKAGEIEVVKNAFKDSQMMTDCILDLLKSIDFGELPRDLPWSYNFRFEAF